MKQLFDECIFLQNAFLLPWRGSRMLQEKRVYWGRKDIYSGDFKKRMSKKDI